MLAKTRAAADGAFILRALVTVVGDHVMLAQDDPLPLRVRVCFRVSTFGRLDAATCRLLVCLAACACLVSCPLVELQLANV